MTPPGGWSTSIRWAVSANLWNAFPGVALSDILGVIRDTGFVGIRISQVRETVDQRVGGDNPASPTRTWTRRNT